MIDAVEQNALATARAAMDLSRTAVERTFERSAPAAAAAAAARRAATNAKNADDQAAGAWNRAFDAYDDAHHATGEQNHFNEQAAVAARVAEGASEAARVAAERASDDDPEAARVRSAALAEASVCYEAACSAATEQAIHSRELAYERAVRLGEYDAEQLRRDRRAAKRAKKRLENQRSSP